jgi:hypothetical protein
MDIILAGTGESGDVTMIVFGAAVLFGLLFFILWFPAWRRRQLLEMREEEFLETLHEDVAAADDLDEETEIYQK